VGEQKVRQVADHVNLILRYVPYVQTNFVFGLDTDEGPAPFELTKLFLRLAPGAFPAFSLLSAFGQAAPLNLTLQRDGRVLPFPFHFLDASQSMNVRPKHYTFPAFYDHLIDAERFAYSWPQMARRFAHDRGAVPKWVNVLRALSSERFGRVAHHARIRRLLAGDPDVRSFHEGTTERVPRFYLDRIRRDLGVLWDALPAGGVLHDQNAYSKKEAARTAAIILAPSARSRARAAAASS